MMRRWFAAAAFFLLLAQPGTPQRPAQEQPARRNIIFILSDDHRYDFMGFLGKPPFLRTPNLDRMVREGAHLQNAFVTTALCSPSRASILTGQYAHRHGVVDNSRAVPPGTVFFPQYLQKAGYQTAFVGKWHMGEESDRPRPGFDHWVSFRGQGQYFDPLLNIDGERQQTHGYVTDLLTDYALEWLQKGRDPARPFFLYLSHKAVHAEFEPAPRHQGVYSKEKPAYPETMANTRSNYRDKPHWVEEQRFSWHGVEFMYHGQFDFDTFYRRYVETLLALDESVGRVLDYLEESGLAKNTLVIYMGDNGFLLGEHGLIDKRNAYEESMRIPMLAWAPGLIRPGTRIEQMILNIDVAPTLLELAGAQMPAEMDGTSFLPLLRGETRPWRKESVYEYFWEYNFPQTPTVYAIRGDRYKYIFYHGIWDLNELYDLEKDPQEKHNLIESPEQQQRIEEMKGRLFDFLEEHNAVDVRFRRPSGSQLDERKLPD